jgi:hypothetical protein
MSLFTLAKESVASESNLKSILICFFDIVGVIHQEFISPSQTVDTKLFCDILRWFREDMRLKLVDRWHTNYWVLHHNDAPTHTALLCSSFWPPKRDGCPYPLTFLS